MLNLLAIPARPGSVARTVLLLSAVVAFPAAAPAAGKTGEQLYKEHCARCHGPSGEGTKKYPQSLAGDKSVAQLANVIDETMPEDDPDKLDAAESKAVAAYIYDAFYSPAAQARIKPARIELSRLTVHQYQNAVADVVGGFRPVARWEWDGKRGLRGEYFNARGFRPNTRLLDRVDPEVSFDFGTAGPETDKEKFDPYQFSIRWEGSVLAPETGHYEFVVRTEHAARLWVNDGGKALIDAWVRSGNDTEHRASVFLLGGRAYPVRLEFSKATQGVNNQKKPDKPPAKAAVALLWKRPHREPEVVPSRYLSPAKFPEAYVVTTPFPPDDRSLGWERATTISKAWDQATTDAALDTAAYVVARLDELSGVPANAPDRAAKLRDFCRKFAERAFRRPLTDDQRRFFVDRQFEVAKDPETAVKRVVLLTLMSPRFLYHEANGGFDGYDVACRLSFGLWDSLPDQPLLDAAAAGKLGTREEVARQAERMLDDPRARAKLREFLLTWLKVEQPSDVAKDPKRYPGFDAAAASDLRASLELFLDDVAWGGSSDFRQLLLSDEVYLNGRLAKFYGADLPADVPFQKLRLDPGKRAGVLTHPYLLAAFAYTGETSPIHRGVFVARGVLGLSLRPPPEAFTPLPADLHPTLTTRERVALQTKPQACATCHTTINNLGFTLEGFDAVGRFRETDNGKPVDTTGSYQTRAGEVVKFAGVRDLATFLAASPEVHASFAEQLFHHLVKQPVRAYGPDTHASLRNSFEKNGFNIRRLMVEVMATSALTPRAAKPPPGPAGGSGG